MENNRACKLVKEKLLICSPLLVLDIFHLIGASVLTGRGEMEGALGLKISHEKAKEFLKPQLFPTQIQRDIWVQ